MSKWISISDELPEQGESIFFVRRGSKGNVSTFGYRLGIHWQDQKFSIRIPSCEVFSWQYMKIPEPPKPEGPFSWDGEFVIYKENGQVKHSCRPYDMAFLADWINRVLIFESRKPGECES